MKIGIQTWGSSGDVRPFIALAGGLTAAGHDVTLAFTGVDNNDYSSLADRLNFRIFRAFDKFEVTPEIIDRLIYCILKERNPVKQLSIILDDFFEPAVSDMYEASLRLCQENEIVIGHFIVYPLRAAAEKTGRPYITVALNHGFLSSRYAPPVGLPDLGSWINPFWWRVVDAMINRGIKPNVNGFLMSKGLPPVEKIGCDFWESKLLNLIAVSQHFCRTQKDWKAHNQVCGFCNVPESAEDWHMPDDLKRFIETGELPVYMTFGSLMPPVPEGQEEIISLMYDAAALAGCRAIIQTSLDDLSRLPTRPDVYYIKVTPHNRIFPYCAAVVHHGGAGTSQSATLAGCPSVVVAHIVEQKIWGCELERLGIAPKLINRRSLTAKKLADAIRRVLFSPTMKERAQEISRAMRNEDGVGKAVELIERRFSGLNR
ncbi:MAG: glycosyltransferase family 1 protein [Nitrospirae bacterium]|nr:glycosyltransferase family 1 protein [Nitrospirota bacterium]